MQAISVVASPSTPPQLLLEAGERQQALLQLQQAKEPAEENEQQAEEKVAEAKPAEEKAAGEEPAEEKPAEEKPAEEKPAASAGAVGPLRGDSG